MDAWDFELKKNKKRKRKVVRFKDLILFEDERVVVVNKPAEISSLSDRDDEVNMLSMGREYEPELRLCHRLDKDTTGVMLFAKGEDMYREIAGLFAKREVLKHYVALVHGIVRWEEHEIELPIEVSGAGRARIGYENGKESLTIVSTAEAFGHYTLMDCHPLTGRMHQVRIHLSAAGHPLVGDMKYGGHDIYLSELKRNFKYNRKEEEPPINTGFLLHARGLRLPLPGDAEDSTFIAPLPAKYETALRILRKYDAPK